VRGEGNDEYGCSPSSLSISSVGSCGELQAALTLTLLAKNRHDAHNVLGSTACQTKRMVSRKIIRRFVRPWRFAIVLFLNDYSSPTRCIKSTLYLSNMLLYIFQYNYSRSSLQETLVRFSQLFGHIRNIMKDRQRVVYIKTLDSVGYSRNFTLLLAENTNRAHNINELGCEACRRVN